MEYDNDKTKLQNLQTEMEKLKGSEEGLKTASNKIVSYFYLIVQVLGLYLKVVFTNVCIPSLPLWRVILQT